MNQEKEIVLIIGGSKGIGEAIVRRVASKDRIVIFTYNKSLENAEKISNELGFENEFHQLDIKDSDAVTSLIEDIGNRYKKIDVLVNNCGVTKDNPLFFITDEDWFNVLNTNLSGVFYACRAVSKYMIRKRKGKIVNISSISAQKGGRGQVNYSASKGGVESLTKALAKELAKKKILVNCVSPGVIDTDMTKQIQENYDDIIKSNILLKRIGKPEEVANVVNFLISDEASYITGQVINVDGGML